MLQIERKKFILYIIFIIVFIFFTNNFYTFQQTLLINQFDGLSYMKIANSSHKFSEELLPYHHAQRFFLPYLIGSLGNLLKVDNYLIFIIFVYFSIGIIIILHFLLVFKSKSDFKTAIMISSLVFLNPYLIRYFISVPTMVNDIFFLMGLYIFIYGLFKKNYLIYLGVLVTLISRQTGLFVFMACIFYLYNNKMFKSILYISLLFVLVFMTSNFYANNSSINGFEFKHLYGLFYSIFSKDLVYTIKWIMLPLYGFIPILIYSFTRKNIFSKKINLEKIILIFIFLSTIGIGILAGPDLAGRNIIRQTVIVLPVISIYLLFYSFPNNNKRNFLIYEKILLIFIFISSFHPVYSKIKFLELIKIL